MKYTVANPTRAYLSDYSSQELEELTKKMTYINTANQYDLKRHYNNKWLKNKNREVWEAKLEELKGNVKKIVMYKEDEKIFIRPGSLPYLDVSKEDVVNKVQYPAIRKVPWAKMLPFELHEYQKLSVIKLIEEKHGNVALTTGSGKSAIILTICREMGLRAAIVTPSKNIFNSLLKDFETYLGRGNVGAYGAGKKKIGKRFTVCIDDSLVNLVPGTEEWDFFQSLDILIVDESHTFAAESLETICHGVLDKAPYRFFLSATQTRGDGSIPLLQSIIGKTVHTLTTEEAIKGGFICDHDFTIIEIESSNPNYNSNDPLETKRIHFLNNKNIAAVNAKIANGAAKLRGEQTLILIDELSQINLILPLLEVPYVYAHSESSKKRLESIGLEKVDPAESIEKFNKGEAMVLIGTSCISVGSNIYPVHNTINWVGGSSEIRTKQGAVGRSVRLGRQNPWAARCKPKSKCKIIDYDVKNVYVLGKHLESRIEFYKDSGTPINHVKLK